MMSSTLKDPSFKHYCLQIKFPAYLNNKTIYLHNENSVSFKYITAVNKQNSIWVRKLIYVI